MLRKYGLLTPYTLEPTGKFDERYDVSIILEITFKLESHTMKSMKALQQSTKRACLFH